MQTIREAVAALLVCACTPIFAATTRVVIDRGQYTGALEVRIGVPQEDSEPKWVEAKRLRDESTVEIAPLPAGTYVVLVSGAAPFERFAITAGVRGEGDEVLRVTLPKPRRIRGTIRIGDKGVGEAVLNFQHRQFGWSTNVSASAEGTFESALWQD